MAVREREVVTDDTVATRPVAAVPARHSAWRLANVIYVLFGILEIILAFRLIFLLFGANTTSAFVQFIYNVSEPFVSPFYGIFSQVSPTDGTIHSLFDPATLVAMVVYAVICWIIVRLIEAVSGRPVDTV